MSTKGASYRYGNTRGASSKGIRSNHISYAWAKAFNKYTIDQHFTDHGKSMWLDSKDSYVSHAIKFANTVDRKNNISFIDKNDSTYKYNKKTNELAIITNDGFIISYFKPKNGINYYFNQKKRK